MNNTAEQIKQKPLELNQYHSILLATDSSDHANQCTVEASRIANAYQAKITATHAYAAKMHDVRFRQMEGGLPEQFKEEVELERQRDIHDDLITRGLSIITESYLDQTEKTCKKDNIPFTRRSLEGKNYRAILDEIEQGDYDLLMLGSVGLGAIEGSRLGTVTLRCIRNSTIDSLVIKNTQTIIENGTIVIALDGSAKSWGGFLTGLALAQEWNCNIKVVAAYDPYYHYVAFNRIADVLSEEAGKIFKFKEQEQLHEDIIDDGLAKIYSGHLDIAKDLAKELNIKIEIKLLDGKPHDAIEKYCKKVNASLLVIGKLGIHADANLDIGGNAENLLRNVDCAILLSQKEYMPEVDVIADATTTWTHEAEARMKRVPSFVQNMARMGILRYAQARGHTVITSSIVEEATASMMPGRAEQAMTEIVEAFDGKAKAESKGFTAIQWEDNAKAELDKLQDKTQRDNIAIRTEKKARVAGSTIVTLEHLADFIKIDTITSFNWDAAANARLMRVPEGFMRQSAKNTIENHAKSLWLKDITLDIAEQGLKQARDKMQQSMENQPADKAPPKVSKCPFAKQNQDKLNDTQLNNWTEEAINRLDAVPEGYCRDMTIDVVNTMAKEKHINPIFISHIEAILTTFSNTSETIKMSMTWTDEAQASISKAPNMVKGMLVQEIENKAKKEGLNEINKYYVDTIKNYWKTAKQFHLDPNDPRNTQ